MRWILDRRIGKLVPADEYKPQARTQIITDTMDQVQSMADGKYYDSKSRYRAELKARGMVEIGNERVEQKRPDMPSVAPDLARMLDN